MRIPSFLTFLLLALPLAAQAPQAGAAPGPRRVVAPCELTSASLGPSGEDSPSQGRGFAIHIMNGSMVPIVLPAYPEFGWRVETLEKKGWKLKSEGGPVRRVRDTDPHLASNLHITTEDDYVAFVRGQLRAALHDKRGSATLDVLLHVNSFTAAHLDEWIDELTADAPKNARDQLPFDIPAGYLEADDLFVDLSVVKALLAGY
jgi:hypothetical protein